MKFNTVHKLFWDFQRGSIMADSEEYEAVSFTATSEDSTNVYIVDYGVRGVDAAFFVFSKTDNIPVRAERFDSPCKWVQDVTGSKIILSSDYLCTDEEIDNLTGCEEFEHTKLDWKLENVPYLQECAEYYLDKARSMFEHAQSAYDILKTLKHNPNNNNTESITYEKAATLSYDPLSERGYSPSKEFSTVYKGIGYEVTFNYHGDVDSIRTVNPEGPAYWHDVVDELTEQEKELLDNIKGLEFQFLCDCDGNVEEY